MKPPPFYCNTGWPLSATFRWSSAAFPTRSFYGNYRGPRLRGCGENFDTERLVRFAAGVFPGTELMVVVTDHSANGAGVRKAFGAMARRFEFLDGTEVPFEKILERLRQLPPRSVVIASMFTHDNLGAYMPARESSRRIAEASTAPVFSPNTSELGQGYLAGNANGGFRHGEIAGQIALRVLRGEAPASIPIASDGPAEPVVDHAAMVRWGLREFDLPAGATVVNRPRGWRDFYESNRVVVLGGAGFVALLCGIIVALVLSIIRGREAERALRNQPGTTAAGPKVGPSRQLGAGIGQRQAGVVAGGLPDPRTGSGHFLS